MLGEDATDAWERLCGLLDDDALLLPRVRAAMQDGDDPWEALLDGLDDAGALASLRADDTGMELADALAQLPRVFRLQPDLGSVNDTDELDRAMELAGRILAEDGFRLVLLSDADEDDHSLVVVPADAAEEVGRVADSLGRTVTAFG